MYSFISDADMHRVYVAEDPRGRRTQYLITCEHAARRLKAYGVPEGRIFIMGWLLPKENIGTLEGMEILKRDVARQLFHLDLGNRFCRCIGRRRNIFWAREISTGRINGHSQ